MREITDADMAYMRRCVWGFMRRLPAHVEYDDMLGPAQEGLVRAALRYDGTSAWTSYAWRRMVGAMQDELRALQPGTRTHPAPAPLSLELRATEDGQTLGDTLISSDDVAATVIRRDALARAGAAIRRLPARQGNMLRRVNGGERMAAIADDHGVTEARVSQIIKDARAKVQEEAV